MQFAIPGGGDQRIPNQVSKVVGLLAHMCQIEQRINCPEQLFVWFAVVFPIVGGEDRSSVPPKVTVPEPVIGPPVKVNPFTVPAVPTLVTVPVVGVAHDGTPEAKVKT